MLEPDYTLDFDVEKIRSIIEPNDGYKWVYYDPLGQDKKLEENGFTKVEFNVNTIDGNRKPKTKTETLWRNYDLPTNT